MIDVFEAVNLQRQYNKLLCDGKLSKKAMCDLVIPFRDKYGLSDIEALNIARGGPNDAVSVLESFIYDDIEFKIANKHYLWAMVNSGEKKDIVIPDEFPNGITITSVGSRFCSGLFSKIVFPDTVKNFCVQAFVSTEPFTGNNATHIDEVVWPSNCDYIPDSCFNYSSIGAVSNIDHVSKIESSAFQNSSIKKLNWPISCKEIPTFCFSNSCVEEVVFTGDIEKIGAFAFGFVRTLKSLDLSHSFNIEIEAGAFDISAKGKITFPYYMPQNYRDVIFL